MIDSGVDGLSRGDETLGVMRGVSLRHFVPVHVSCLDRQPGLEHWIRSWAVSDDQRACSILQPLDWEVAVSPRTTYIWAPDPAAALAAAKTMASCIHMNSSSCHVFLVPRLMTAWWNRLAWKATNLHLSIPVGTTHWPPQEHEPLLLLIYFPLSHKQPWRHKGTRNLEQLDRHLSGLWASDFHRAGPLLRGFLLRAWRDASL